MVVDKEKIKRQESECSVDVFTITGFAGVWRRYLSFSFTLPVKLLKMCTCLKHTIHRLQRTDACDCEKARKNASFSEHGVYN
ncbi:hypothetical protein POVWA2_031800 [Plasmodium ovale wallikeri]|uniref:Uncharacterized protein n=1 Tax=Plasmodium ovale wallikeri TaxID=864142 RepID=A0A1A8YXM6_PLAOA|nr:hypothetical protein POVWA1_032080 [Plasmodium ovale wallikeri]SBT36750.1 hypothetical protein POVWA2_031800 [Plasmodium ovale wallikeri]